MTGNFDRFEFRDYFFSDIVDKGERVSDEIPLTPLANVGRALIKPSSFCCAKFVLLALSVLTDEAFFVSDVLGENKHATRPLARDCRGYGEHMKTLTSVADDSSGRVMRPASPSEVRGYSSYFAVLKDKSVKDDGTVSTSARAIFDARIFNEFCNRPPRFDLCSAPEILSVLAGFGTKKLFFYAADYMNYYYQLPIPFFIGCFMCLYVQGQIFLPLVLPMGWSWSCWLAQSLTWGIILRTVPGDEDLGIPDFVDALSTPPGHITMNDGTVILVIYDTILVIATCERRARTWGERIGRNSRLAQVLPKYEKFTQIVDFGGIKIESTTNGTVWSVIPSTVQSWSDWAKRSSRLRSNAEALWKAMGFLRFVAPIVDLLPGSLGELTEVQSMTAADAPLRCRSDYRKIRSELRGSLEKACQLIQSIDYKPRHWKSHTTKIRRIWKAASDATKECEAFVIFGAGNPSVKDGLEPDEIMVREAGALADCIEKWHSMSELDDVLIVLCDNQSVLRSFARGWTSCSEMKDIISRVRPILISRRIVFVDIHTDSNYADIFSRPDETFSEEEIAHRLKATLERAEAANLKFRSDRTQLLMRFDICNSELQEVDERALRRLTWTADEWDSEILNVGSKRSRDGLDDF